MVSGLSSLSSSLMPQTAASSPSTATSMAVAPVSSIASILLSTSLSAGGIFRSFMNGRLPMATVRPLTLQLTPLPVTAWNSGGLKTLLAKSDSSSERRTSQYFTTATASGCSEERSAHSTIQRSSSFATLSSKCTNSSTAGFPMVRVPVLSKMMVSTLAADSRASPPLIRTPFWAPTPVPVMMAVGAARPRAQGQAITRVVIANMKENINGPSSEGIQESGTTPVEDRENHITKDARETEVTKGTKTPEILSA